MFTLYTAQSSMPISCLMMLCHVIMRKSLTYSSWETWALHGNADELLINAADFLTERNIRISSIDIAIYVSENVVALSSLK